MALEKSSAFILCLTFSNYVPKSLDYCQRKVSFTISESALICLGIKGCNKELHILSSDLFVLIMNIELLRIIITKNYSYVVSFLLCFIVLQCTICRWSKNTSNNVILTKPVHLKFITAFEKIETLKADT